MKVSSITLLFIYCFILSFFLVYLLYHQNNSGNVNQAILQKTIVNASEDNIFYTNLFYKIASNLGIDKISHRYHNLYGTHLGPLRHKPLNFLEIGLGCTMNYGPGKSLLAWKQYLTNPDTKISYIEFDRDCALKFNPPVVHKMFIGDQANFEFLDRVGHEAGPFDFIVDDGGHKRTHQINSLIGLWPFLKSNGVYVLEDICSTLIRGYDDSEETPIDIIYKLIMILNDAINPNIPNKVPIKQTFSPSIVELSKTILSINCYYRACVFIKK